MSNQPGIVPVIWMKEFSGTSEKKFDFITVFNTMFNNKRARFTRPTNHRDLFWIIIIHIKILLSNMEY